MKTLQILPASGMDHALIAQSIDGSPLDLTKSYRVYPVSIVAWEVMIEDGKYTVTGLVALGNKVVRVTELAEFTGYSVVKSP